MYALKTLAFSTCGDVGENTLSPYKDLALQIHISSVETGKLP